MLSGHANIALSDLISSSILLDKVKPIVIDSAQVAEVAELVDALGSGSSGCMPVRVQIPASAPFFCAKPWHPQERRRVMKMKKSPPDGEEYPIYPDLSDEADTVRGTKVLYYLMISYS